MPAHLDGQVRHHLGTVHEEKGPMRVHQLRDLLDRIDDAGDIRDSRDGDVVDLAAMLVESAGDAGDVDAAQRARGHRRGNVDHFAKVLAMRQIVRVVLHDGRHHDVPIRPSRTQYLCHPIDAPGSAASVKKGRVVLGIGVHELEHGLVSTAVLLGGELGGEVEDAVGIGIIRKEAIENVLHHLEAKRRCGAVEVDATRALAAGEGELGIEADDLML